MKTYKHIVREASGVLKAHDFGKNDKVNHFWADMEWQEMPKQEGRRDAEADTDGQSVIRLYPSLLQMPNAPQALLREFGNVIKAKGGSRAGAIWEKKLDLPTPSQIGAAHSLLTGPVHRAKCQTYAQMMTLLPDKGSAVDRLVFINITNALLANNLPFKDSQGVNIRKWGPTVEYCNFKKYHSLVPFTSAYCPQEIHECFGRAFAELLTTNLACCRDSSVAEGLRRIIKNVVSRLEPFPPVG